MKRADQFGDKATKAERPQSTKVIAAPTTAISYWRAAERDERNGFRLTAAMEWQKAAELMAALPAAADFCWTQWERIMNLPRQLAQPIPAAPQLPGSASSTCL